MAEWYIDSNRTKVDLSTALPGGVPTVTIYRLVTDAHGSQYTYMWANAGRKVDAARIAAAMAAQSGSAVPAAGSEAARAPPRQPPTAQAPRTSPAT